MMDGYLSKAISVALGSQIIEIWNTKVLGLEKKTTVHCLSVRRPGRYGTREHMYVYYFLKGN